MPFDPMRPRVACPLCSSPANAFNLELQWTVVDCSLCGDFRLSDDAENEAKLFIEGSEKLALLRYLLRKLQKQQQRPALDATFFEVAGKLHLPTPAEACDNMVKWLAEKAHFRPGTMVFGSVADEAKIFSEVGVVDGQDLTWLLETLERRRLLHAQNRTSAGFYANLSSEGWQRYEELQRAHISSNYAFFARKFENDTLDEVVERCLRPAVEQTGFELRTVTQRAGLIDAIIEDEIRRCKFLLADLSDHNAGAYWEAGFAEGLGKPVIYLCREKQDDGSDINTHFDTDHRHTIRWNPSSLDAASKQLKAVIRNTLLGDAKQDD